MINISIMQLGTLSTYIKHSSFKNRKTDFGN